MSENCNIQVLIRVRPLNSREIKLNAKSCVENEQFNNQQLTLNANNEQKIFSFDHIFDESSTQQDIFIRLGQNFTDSFLQGYNVCIFAYGQTGAGQTYTMQGSGLEFNSEQDVIHKGLQPRVLQYIFNQLKEDQNEYLIRCSYLEIYNEQIMDLLSPSGNNLHIREDIQRGVYIEGLCQEVSEKFQDTLTLLRNGARNRHVGATSMNFQSSRSHSLFTISLETRQKEGTVQSVKSSHLHFVDLAGSERQTLTGAKGDRLKEAGNINKSLTILGIVINNLVQISNGKARHVPYRDSKLTFILQDSLGGNSRTAIIAAISSANCSFQETLCTLKFAQRAKMIKNKATINEQSSGSVQSLKEEIKKLRNELALSREELHRYQNLDIMKSIQKPNKARRKVKEGMEGEEIDGDDDINNIDGVQGQKNNQQMANEMDQFEEDNLLAFPDDETFEKAAKNNQKSFKDNQQFELEKLDLLNQNSIYQSVVRELQGMCDQLALSESNQKIISKFLLYQIENQNRKIQSLEEQSDTTQATESADSIKTANNSSMNYNNQNKSNNNNHQNAKNKPFRLNFNNQSMENQMNLDLEDKNSQKFDLDEMDAREQEGNNDELDNEDEEDEDLMGSNMNNTYKSREKLEQSTPKAKPKSSSLSEIEQMNSLKKRKSFASVKFDEISLNQIKLCIQNSRSQLLQFKQQIQQNLEGCEGLRQSWRTPQKFREIDHMMSEIYTEFKGRSQNYQMDLQQTLEREKYLEKDLGQLTQKYNKLIGNFENMNKDRNEEMKKLHVEYQKLKFDLMNLSRDREQSAQDASQLEKENFALQNALQKANAEVSILQQENVLARSKENLKECETNEKIAKIMEELNMKKLELEKASVTQMNLQMDSEQFREENNHLLHQLTMEEKINIQFQEKLTHSQASLQAMQYSLDNLESKAANLEDEVARLKEENQSLVDSNTYLQSQIDDKQKRIDELVSTSQKLINQQFHLQESLNSRNQEFEALKRQIQNIDDDNNPLSKFIKQCREMEAKNQELHMTVDYYHRQNSEMKNSLYQLSQRINQLHISQNHFKLAFEDIRNRYNQKEVQQKNIREKIQIFEQENKKLKEENEQISHKYNRDRDERSNHESIIKKLEENILRKSEEQTKSVALLDKLNKKCEQLEKQHQNDLRTYLNLKETTSQLLTVYNQNMSEFQNLKAVSEAREVQFNKLCQELRDMKLKNSDIKNQLEEEIYVGKQKSQKLQKYHEKLMLKQKLLKHQHQLTEAFKEDVDGLEDRIEGLFKYIEQCESACSFIADKQEDLIRFNDVETGKQNREENTMAQLDEAQRKNQNLESMVTLQIQTIEQLRQMIEQKDGDIRELTTALTQKDQKIYDIEKLKNYNLHEAQRLFEVEKYNLRLKELEENQRHFNFEIERKFQEMEKTIVCMEAKYMCIKDANDRIFSIYQVFRIKENINQNDELFIREVIQNLVNSLRKANEIDTTRPPNFDIMKKLNDTKWSHFQKMFISQICQKTNEMNVTLQIEENFCSDQITKSNLQFLISNLNVCHPDIQFYLNSFLLEEINKSPNKNQERSQFSTAPVAENIYNQVKESQIFSNQERESFQDISALKSEIHQFSQIKDKPSKSNMEEQNKV